MINNQFFYTRRQPRSPKEGETGPQFENFTDSFNVNMVIRTMELEDKRILVLLDDAHDRHEKEQIVNKRNQVTGTRNAIHTYQSEIYLSPEDGQRFRDFATV